MFRAYELTTGDFVEVVFAIADSEDSARSILAKSGYADLDLRLASVK